MQKLMISAAMALLVSPALAQDRHHGGGPGGQPPQQAAPGGDYGPGKAGFGRASAAMHGAPQPAPGAPQAAAPAPQPQPQQGGNRGSWSHDRSDNNWRGRDDHRGDNDRRDNDNWRGHDDHRGDSNWQGNNRPGWQGNPNYNRRPNYSNFSRYHQNFRADRRFHAGSYRRPPGWYYRRWSFGQILPSLFWAQQYWLNDYMDYDLPPPPPGTVWVRYGNDALLIDRFTGEIITVQYEVFY